MIAIKMNNVRGTARIRNIVREDVDDPTPIAFPSVMKNGYAKQKPQLTFFPLRRSSRVRMSDNANVAANVSVNSTAKVISFPKKSLLH